MAYEVTIGIPVYNVEKYIRLMMDSALAQTFESIEFLVLDDCGTDSSIAIVKEYQQTHPRGKDIRIVRQPHNMGAGCARNRIVDEARGKYLYHLDADDVISPNAIELLYNAAQQYQAEIVYGSHERIEEYGEKVHHKQQVYPALQFLKENEFPLWAYRKYDGIQVMNWNFLIDINIYRKNGLRHKAVNFWEDFSFTIDLPTYITRAVMLSDITYFYYCRNGSLSNFQKRDHIDKSEIMRTIESMNENKDNTDRIREKPYFPLRMYKLIMTDFYMVCNVLQNSKIISPAFTTRELKAVMKSPLTLGEILRFRQKRMANLALYAISILPAPLFVCTVRILGKMKGLI